MGIGSPPNRGAAERRGGGPRQRYNQITQPWGRRTPWLSDLWKPGLSRTHLEQNHRKITKIRVFTAFSGVLQRYTRSMLREFGTLAVHRTMRPYVGALVPHTGPIAQLCVTAQARTARGVELYLRLLSEKVSSGSGHSLCLTVPSCVGSLKQAPPPSAIWPGFVEQNCSLKWGSPKVEQTSPGSTLTSG